MLNFDTVIALQFEKQLAFRYSLCMKIMSIHVFFSKYENYAQLYIIWLLMAHSYINTHR